jgi:hypothetical protein
LAAGDRRGAKRHQPLAQRYGVSELGGWSALGALV